MAISFPNYSNNRASQRRYGLDALVVFPNNRSRALGSIAADIAAITPPVEAGLLSAYLGKMGFMASLLDADANNLLPDQVADEAQKTRPRLVIICTDHVNSGDVTKMAAAGETAKILKNRIPDLPVMMVGNVPTAYPERIMFEEHADLVCQGEPYEPVSRLLAKCLRSEDKIVLADNEIEGIWQKEGTSIIKSNHAGRIADIDELPLTPWDIMPPSKYRAHHWHCFDRLNKRTPYAAVFTNMGCPHSCTFCSVNVAAGGPNLRFRSVDRICEEIDVLVSRYGVSNIRILDNIFTVRMDRVEEICDRISKRWSNLNLWAYARVDSIKDFSILPKMKRAGINWLAFGFETAHERVKSAVHKTTKPDIEERVIEKVKEAGINIVGNFIFGLPDDDFESMRLTFEMAKTYMFEWANFYCAMAYPGTVLYEQALKEGWKLPANWSGYSQYSPDSMPLATKNLSSKEVLFFRDRAFLEYYESERYQRMIESKFGRDAVDFVRMILSHKIKRNE